MTVTMKYMHKVSILKVTIHTLIWLSQEQSWCKYKGGEFSSSHTAWLVQKNLHKHNIYKVNSSWCNTASSSTNNKYFFQDAQN
jgi:hypothetical protein